MEIAFKWKPEKSHSNACGSNENHDEMKNMPLALHFMQTGFTTKICLLFWAIFPHLVSLLLHYYHQWLAGIFYMFVDACILRIWFLPCIGFWCITNSDQISWIFHRPAFTSFCATYAFWFELFFVWFESLKIRIKYSMRTINRKYSFFLCFLQAFFCYILRCSNQMYSETVDWNTVFNMNEIHDILFCILHYNFIKYFICAFFRFCCIW